MQWTHFLLYNRKKFSTSCIESGDDMDFIMQLITDYDQFMYQYQYPVSNDTKMLMMIGMGILFVLGIVNVILGFRLMRFWMILASLGIGLGLSVFLIFQFHITRNTALLCGGMVGLILAVLSFFVYNWGLFVVGTGIGSTVGVYLTHPRTSLTFFLCILVSVILGILAMKFSKPILILGTSVVGGILSGVAVTFLGRFFYPGPMGIPYSVLFSVGFVFLGIIIQSFTNRVTDDDDEVTPLVEDIIPGEGTGKIRRDDFGRKYRA